jgi:hypothetical protein
MTQVSWAKPGRWALLALAIAGLVVIVAGSMTLVFEDSGSEADKELPGRVQRVDGTDVGRVILTAEAVKRVGIATQPVRDEQVAGATRRVIPNAAVLYDASGATWTYTNPEPLVFMRVRITVDSIQGDRAVLSSGPAAGTQVVTVGVFELYGTEYGVSGDE